MNMDTVINEASKYFNIKRDVLVSRDRTDKVAKARQILYKVLTMFGKTSTQIGEKLQRDHSSVIVGLGKVERNEELFNKALYLYHFCYDKDDEIERRVQKRLLFDRIKRLINEGKEGEIENTKENNDIIFKIKHGAQKKVPDYKHSTYRTIYL